MTESEIKILKEAYKVISKEFRKTYKDVYAVAMNGITAVIKEETKGE